MGFLQLQVLLTLGAKHPSYLPQLHQAHQSQQSTIPNPFKWNTVENEEQNMTSPFLAMVPWPIPIAASALPIALRKLSPWSSAVQWYSGSRPSSRHALVVEIIQLVALPAIHTTSLPVVVVATALFISSTTFFRTVGCGRGLCCCHHLCGCCGSRHRCGSRHCCGGGQGCSRGGGGTVSDGSRVL